jgi:DnaJ-domain-containing protein 1
MKRIAPPKRRTPHPGLLLFPFKNIAGMAGLLVIAVIAVSNGWIGLILAPALIGSCVVLLMHGYRTREATRRQYHDLDRGYAQDYELAKRRWQQSQVCLDCGHVFDGSLNSATSTHQNSAEQQRAEQQRQRAERPGSEQQQSAKNRTQDQAATKTAAKSDHESLEVSPNASDEEIDAAYRHLSQMYHPDKVESLAPEYKAIAVAKMKEINAAYARMKRRAKS